MTATRRSSGAASSYAPPPPPSQAGQGPPPFLNKTYDLVEEASTDPVISWSPDGHSFVVWRPAEFARDLLPLHFKHNNFSSFVRQLNTYGFRKVDPDRWEFANDCFIRGRKDLLKDIHRRKAGAQPVGVGSQLANVGGPAIEVGSFGGLADEVEGLKRDKNVLMLELVRLRQQQQNSEAEIRKLHARLEKTDERQQHMMAFLQKALHDPSFLQQILASRPPAQRITTGRKKRRAQRAQDSGSDGDSSPIEDPNMQLVQYQPTQNDFSKPFLHMLQREGNPYVDESAVPGQEDGDFDVDTAFGGLNIRPTPRSDVTITEDLPQPGPSMLYPGMPTIPASPLQSPLAGLEHQGGASPLIIGSRPIDPTGAPAVGQHDGAPMNPVPLEAAHFTPEMHASEPLRPAMDSLDFLPDMMCMQSGELHDDMGEDFWQALINHPQDGTGTADGFMYDHNGQSYHPAGEPSNGPMLNAQ